MKKMGWFPKQALVFLLVFTQIWAGFVSPALASEPPLVYTTPLPTLPPYNNSIFEITVLVQAPDPANPGAFLPIENMEVHLRGADQTRLTGPEGLTTFTVNSQGTDFVSLVLPDNPDLPPWAGNRLDAHETMIVVGDKLTTYVTITLEPRDPADDGTTGGVRLHKVYYPYPFGAETLNNAMLNLLDVTGPSVAGAQFIVAEEDFTGIPPTSAWLRQGSNTDFTATPEEARKYVSGEDGQVLIDGLLPGDYVAYEYSALTGEPVELLRLQHFTVSAGMITSAPLWMELNPFVNTEPSYSMLFEKRDRATQECLSGAAFIVYKLDENNHPQYLSYRTPPTPPSALLPAYTPYEDQAHVFESSLFSSSQPGDPMYWMQAKGSFIVSGLEPGVPYFIREVTPPAGYADAGADISVDETLKISYDGVMTGEVAPQIIDNDRITSAQVFTKYLSNSFLWGLPGEPLPGARFMLYRANAQGGQEVAIGGGTQDNQPLVFDALPFDFDTELAAFQASRPADYDMHNVYQDFAAFLNPASQVFTSQDPSGSLVIYGLPEDSAGQVYYLREISAPQGVSVGLEKAFTIVNGEVVPFPAPEPPPEGELPPDPRDIINTLLPGSLLIRKTDLFGTPLSQVGFRIYIGRMENGVYTRHYLTDTPAAPTQQDPNPALPLSGPDAIGEAMAFTTNANGQVVVPNLPVEDALGNVYTYNVEEIEPPAGYLMSSDSSTQSFSFAGLASPHYEMHFTNTKVPPVPVDLPAVKELRDLQGNLLNLADYPPFTFEVLFKNEVIGTLHNDENGSILFEDVWIDTSTMTQQELASPATLTLREVMPEDPVPGIIYDTRQYVIPFYFSGPLLDEMGVHPQPENPALRPNRITPRASPYVAYGTYSIVPLILGGQLSLDLRFVNIYNLTEPFLVEKKFVGIQNYVGIITIDLLQKDLEGNFVLFDRVYVDGTVDAGTEDAQVPGEYEPWKYRWVGLPSHIPSHDPATGITTLLPAEYRISEFETPPDFEDSVVMDETGNFLVNNSRPGTVIARKDWDGNPPSGTLQFQLYQKVLETGEERARGGAVTLTGQVTTDGKTDGELADWRYLWTGLPKEGVSDTGAYESYKYLVKEPTPPEGYVWDTVASTSLRIVNRLTTTSRTVTKQWQGGSEPRPPVTFVLMQDGKDYLEGTIEPGKTSFTWENLPRYSVPGDPSSREYVYTVREIPLTQYSGQPAGDGWSYLNTFVPPLPAYVPLRAAKTFEGQELSGDDFTFQLFRLQDNVETLLQERTNNALGEVAFESLKITAPGTFIYRLREKDGGDPAIAYDKREYQITVTSDLLDNNTLFARITNVLLDGAGYSDPNLVFLFENKPAPEETDPPTDTDPPVVTDPPAYQAIRVPLQARKEQRGGRLTEGAYTFTLKDHAGNELETVANHADGSIVFTPRRFSRTGTFLYTLTENSGGNASIAYDSTVYTARVRVTASGGQLSAQVDYLKDDMPIDAVPLFVNTVIPPSTGDDGPRNILIISVLALMLLGGAVMVERRRKKRL